MVFKAIYPLVAVVGIAVASGAAWWYQSRPGAPKEMTAAAAGTAPGAKAASAPAPRPAGVELARVERLSLQDDAESVGTLRSRQGVMLRPEVAGRVKTLGFSDGARVRKGQLLVQLDDVLQQAEVSQAQAQVSIAQSNFRRNQELVAQNFVAQRVLDESAANLQVAQAQRALAGARLSRMAIRAPFDGTLGIRSINVGDYVKDGADLVNIEDISSMVVDFRLPERYQGKLRPQQPVELTLDAFPGRSFRARVEAIDPLLDANGRSVGVRALLPNTAGEASFGKTAVSSTVDAAAAPLRPGMFARVTTVFAVNDAALVVPEEAILPQGGRQFVIRALDPADLSASAKSGWAPMAADVKWVSLRQEVKLGVRRQGKVEIVEGLQEGQSVVVAGQQRLQKDGTALSVVVLARPPQPAASAAAGTASMSSALPASAASR